MKELTKDKLLPRGYTYCRCEEYHLGNNTMWMGSILLLLFIECVMTGDEGRFYILTPIDIIIAQKTDANDHVDWLIKKKEFKVQNMILYLF